MNTITAPIMLLCMRTSQGEYRFGAGGLEGRLSPPASLGPGVNNGQVACRAWVGRRAIQATGLDPLQLDLCPTQDARGLPEAQAALLDDVQRLARQFQRLSEMCAHARGPPRESMQLRAIRDNGGH